MIPLLDIYRSAQALIRRRYEEAALKSAWWPDATLKTGRTTDC